MFLLWQYIVNLATAEALASNYWVPFTEVKSNKTFMLSDSTLLKVKFPSIESCNKLILGNIKILEIFNTLFQLKIIIFNSTQLQCLKYILVQKYSNT